MSKLRVTDLLVGSINTSNNDTKPEAVFSTISDKFADSLQQIFEEVGKTIVASRSGLA